MKKFLCTVTFVSLFALAASNVFAASYKNNTYQKLAREYTIKAEKALDAGEYELSEEYAAKAQENAALSEAYIKHMLARDTATRNMTLAKNRIDFVKSINADRNFPIAFEAATKFYEQAESSYNSEDYESAISFCQQVIDALAEVYEITPLPKFYIVRPWAQTKDCFWNISGRPYVYDNPLLWENLYQANKSNMPKPNDPNLILPGMKMKIPSITGEYREGVYNPSKKYDPYSANR